MKKFTNVDVLLEQKPMSMRMAWTFAFLVVAGLQSHNNN